MLQNSILQSCITTEVSKINQGRHLLFPHRTAFLFFSEVVHLKRAQVIHSASNIFSLELIQLYFDMLIARIGAH